VQKGLGKKGPAGWCDQCGRGASVVVGDSDGNEVRLCEWCWRFLKLRLRQAGIELPGGGPQPGAEGRR
jgi:hypothetical protein